MDSCNVFLEFFDVSLVFDAEFFVFGIDIADLILDFVFFLDACDNLVEVGLEVLNFFVNVFS